MALGMEVGLGPGPHCVRWEPIPPWKGAQRPPTFWPMSVVAKQLDGSAYHLVCAEVGLGPGDIVLDGDPVPAPSPTKRGTEALTFWPMSIVAKRLPMSATAELLLKFTYIMHADLLG